MSMRLCCSLNSSEIVKSCKYKNKANELQEPKWTKSSYYQYNPTHNVAVNGVVPVLTNSAHFLPATVLKDYPDYSMLAMQWGMVPWYYKKFDTHGYICQHTAMVENVCQAPMFGKLILNGFRCIILADGYYEFQTIYNKYKNQPYFLHQKKPEESLNNTHLMKFAGLFGGDKFGQFFKFYCTILTRPADASLTWLHDRMPIILNTDEDINSWLNYKDVNYVEAFTKLPIHNRFDKKFELHISFVEKAYLDSANSCTDYPGQKRKAESTLDGPSKKK